MNDRGMRDRRQHPRFFAEVAMKVHRANHSQGESLPATLADYSQAGMRFYAERPFSTGEKMSVEFSQEPDLNFRASAEVVWSEKTPDGRYQIGCALSTELTERQMESLGRFATVCM